MKNSSDSKEVMDPRQSTAFLTYYGMSGERSLDRLYQEWAKLLPNFSRPHLNTIKLWSGRFNWQTQVRQMDEETNARLFDEAINSAKEARVDIMKLFKAVVLKFATQLRNSDKQINSFDVMTFWRMARIEMGLPAESSKQVHELGDSFFDLMKMRHERLNRSKTESGLVAVGQGTVIDSE